VSHGEELARFASLLGGPAREATIPQIGVYRKLVRRNFRGALAVMTPRASEALGARLEPLLDAFFEAGLPRSRYLRDVPVEIVAFARARGVGWPCDLADFELADYRVMAAADDPDPSSADLALDRGVRFSASALLLRLDHAIHGWDGRGAPEARVQDLFFHRTAEMDVSTLELEARAASVVRALLEGESLGAAVRASADAGSPVDGALVVQVAAALEEIRRAGGILGPT